MGRTVSDSGGGGDFQQVKPGTYVARPFRLIDIGTQHSEYKGEPVVRNQFILFWELPTEPIDINGEQKPTVVSKFYTASLHEKATLRHDLQSWRGKEFTPEELRGFDITQILGKPCLLTVVTTSSGKSKVSAVTGLPKGTNCPPAVNPVSFFWVNEWNQEAYDALSDGLKKLISESDEYKAMKSGAREPANPFDKDETLPF